MLDITTLRVVFSAVALTLFGLFYLILYRRTRAAYAGWWCLALLVFVASSLLYLSDGTSVQWLGTPIGNLGTVAGAAAVWCSGRSLNGPRPPLWQVLGGPALVGAISAADDPGSDAWAGGTWMLLGAGAYVALAAREMWRHRQVVRPARREVDRLHDATIVTLAVSFASMSAFYFVRGATLWAAGPTSETFRHWFGSEAAVFLHMVLLVIVAFSIGTLSTEQRIRTLRAVATRDSLTGLLNRGEFFRQATASLGQAYADGEGCVAVMADLDYFKSINDRFGHAAGDEVLRAFAQACTDVLGERDLAGRVGGEEFAFLIPGVSPGQAEALVNRIGEHLSTAELPVPVRPTASYGIAPLEAGLTLDELLGRADVALYRAKAAGRDRTVHHRG